MNSRGFTLISVMMVIVLTTALFASIYRLFKFESAFSNQAAAVGLQEDLKIYIRANINCTGTFPAGATLPSACSSVSGGSVAIISKTSTSPTLVEVPSGNNFTRFGAFAIRGWCKDVSGSPEFFIQVNRLSSDGSRAIGDPFKNLLMDGTPASAASASNAVGWVDLFDGDFTCSI